MSRIRKAFTLVELVIAIIIFLIVVLLVTRLFIDMVKTKGGLDGRQALIKESHYLMEKLQIMSRNYSIDYEEYRNRKNTGCTILNNPNWSGTNSCTIMTYYGNKNILGLNGGVDNTKSILYHCSSIADVTLNSFSNKPIVKAQLSSDISNCATQVSSANPTISATIATSGFLQSYGQYRSMFIDVKDDVDLIPGAYKDDDDLNRGDAPEAIYNSTGIQELYLISHDSNYRLFIRKKLIEQGDWNKNGSTGDIDSEKLYSLQILQLRGLDAGENHDFNVAYSGVYDGQIDTWACDYAAGFVCNGSAVGGAYANYKLPAHVDDGWVTLTPTDITLSNRNITILPTKDPYLTWSDTNAQVSPYLQIQFTAKLYGKNRANKIPWSQMDLYSIRLQTRLQAPYLGIKK